MKSKNLWIIAISCLAVGVAAGDSGRRQFYTPHEKAYFLPDSVEFVNPGLTITIQAASIAVTEPLRPVMPSPIPKVFRWILPASPRRGRFP